MKKIDIFLLYHVNQTEKDKADGCSGDKKTLGFFRTKERCYDLIKDYAILPGFRDKPKSFKIKKYKLSVMADDFIPNFVYFLELEYSDERFDYYSEFGVYPEELAAMKKKYNLTRNSKIYSDFKDLFTISEYILDKPEWTEGYDN